MPSLSTTCPSCFKTLKLKSPSAAGKKVKCPQCGDPFEVTLDDNEEQLDELEEVTDDDDDFSPPARSTAKLPARKGGGAKKKSKKGSGGNQKLIKYGMIGGGGAVGVGLLVWLGMTLLPGMFGGINLEWVPAEANSINITRIGAIWNTKLVKEARSESGIDTDAGKMRDSLGFGPEDIESVTTVTFPSSKGVPKQDGGLNFAALKHVMYIVRTKKKMDVEKVLGLVEGTEKQSHDGKEYYLHGGGAIYFPDAYTAISGTEDVVKDAMSRGKKAAKHSEFQFAKGGQHQLMLVAKDEDKESLSPARMMMGGISGQREFLKSVKGMAIGQTYSSTVNSMTQISFSNADAAKDCETTLRDELKKNLEKLEELKEKQAAKTGAENPREGFFAELQESAEEMLRSTRISRSGSVVSITSRINPFKGSKEDDKAEKRRKRVIGSALSFSVRRSISDPRSLFHISSRQPGQGMASTTSPQDVGGTGIQLPYGDNNSSTMTMPTGTPGGTFPQSGQPPIANGASPAVATTAGGTSGQPAIKFLVLMAPQNDPVKVAEDTLRSTLGTNFKRVVLRAAEANEPGYPSSQTLVVEFNNSLTTAMLVPVMQTLNTSGYRVGAPRLEGVTRTRRTSRPGSTVGNSVTSSPTITSPQASWHLNFKIFGASIPGNALQLAIDAVRPISMNTFVKGRIRQPNAKEGGGPGAILDLEFSQNPVALMPTVHAALIRTGLNLGGPMLEAPLFRTTGESGPQSQPSRNMTASYTFSILKSPNGDAVKIAENVLRPILGTNLRKVELRQPRTPENPSTNATLLVELGSPIAEDSRRMISTRVTTAVRAAGFQFQSYSYESRATGVPDTK